MCFLSVFAGACSQAVVNVEAPPPVTISEEAEVSSAVGISVRDGVFSPGQASRGERRFQQGCTSCHRTNEFAGALFRRTWDGETVADLFDLIYTTMPEGNPGSLRLEEYAEIVAYLLSSNEYPAGEEALPTDMFSLENMLIESP